MTPRLTREPFPLTSRYSIEQAFRPATQQLVGAMTCLRVPKLADPRHLSILRPTLGERLPRKKERAPTLLLATWQREIPEWALTATSLVLISLETVRRRRKQPAHLWLRTNLETREPARAPLAPRSTHNMTNPQIANGAVTPLSFPYRAVENSPARK